MSVFATYSTGLHVFDGAGVVLWKSGGTPPEVQDLVENVFEINETGEPFESDGTTLIAQPPTGTGVAELIQLTVRGTRC